MTMRKNKKHKNPGRFHAVMLLWLGITMFILLFPILAIIIMSFNTSKYGTLPFEFTLTWYRQLFESASLLSATAYSFWFSLIVSLTAAALGVTASLALRRLSKKWNETFPTLMNIPVIIPWLVQAVSLLLLFNLLGIGKSFASLFFGCLIAVMPHSFLITYSRVMTMDRYPEEAARTLGASGLRIFRDVTFPMIFPAVLSGLLMSFILCFNCFSIQYYLAPFGTNTLPMLIYTTIRAGYSPDINAIAAILTAVIAGIIFVMNKAGVDAGQLFGQGQKEGN